MERGQLPVSDEPPNGTGRHTVLCGNLVDGQEVLAWHLWHSMSVQQSEPAVRSVNNTQHANIITDALLGPR
jgi:hypothetical protein